MDLVECVPNVSEGQNHSLIRGMAQSVMKATGVRLLNLDPGYSANRTVLTFVGKGQAVVAAIMNLMAWSLDHLDMRCHKGVHPRMGAVDVIPLIALGDTDPAYVQQLALNLADQIGSRFGQAVYTYGQIAQTPQRTNLGPLRKGQYEGLKDRLGLDCWRPDFGPFAFDPRFGATAVGVRKLMVAYNVNLETDNVRVARTIAARIRSSGRGTRRLEGLQSIGWRIPEFGCAQVSNNILDLSKTTMEDVFSAVQREADTFGIALAGSELVGMMPQSALSLHHHADIESVVDRLGLNRIKRFDPRTHILEWALAQKGDGRIPPYDLPIPAYE
ncbi:MAG: glutamate formimidoyltransferase [Acidobacteria bacterium]|nr:glutamate formimidoyltransferase [Acidobacteriota bacterium]